MAIEYEAKLASMSKQIKLHIAHVLRMGRQRLKLTQSELAERIGRTPESISNIERGISLPSIETCLALSAALDIPLRGFFPEVELNGDPSPQRVRAEATAAILLRSLPDEHLEVALDLLRALDRLRKPNGKRP